MDTRMVRAVVLPDVIGEHGVELLQGVDLRDIQGRQPAAAERPEVPFDFAFEARLTGRYSYSLHWLILSMARERQRSGLLPWVPMRVSVWEGRSSLS